MKELKFRAWDKELKKLFYSDDCFFVFKNGVLLERDGETSNIKNSIVMQFTGLKDKNGKEIYEGDIVDGEFQIDKKGIIVYDVPCFQVCYNKTRYTGICWSYLEVIGNVYENEGLLNGTNTHKTRD